MIEGTDVPLWQLPQPAYRQAQTSVAELAATVRPISAFSAWLYDRFTHPPAFVDIGGTWPLGDSPLVLLTALTTDTSRASDRPGRRILADLTYGEEIAGRTIRVFDTIDTRLTFDDFVALLRLNARHPNASYRFMKKMSRDRPKRPMATERGPA